nr:MAG TPA: replisome organizer protein [Caudoviricetes sp.]
MARTGFKRPGRYAALAAAYYDDPAIIAVGTDAELWYVRALAWCAAHPETDGVIPLEVAVNRLGIPDAMSRVTECDSHGLVTKSHADVSVTNWLKWNAPYRDTQAKNDAKRAAARARKARERARKSEQPTQGNVTRDMGRDMGRDKVRDTRDKEKREKRKETITTPLLVSPSSESLTPAVAETQTVAADAAPATASAKPASKSSKARGTRLPDGWVPDDALIAWTRANAPAAANAVEVERFRDYWTAQPGAKGRKTDWAATWRNWARRCQEQHTQPHRGPAPRATTSDRVNGWLALAESLDPNHQPPSQPSLIAIEGGAA